MRVDTLLATIAAVVLASHVAADRADAQTTILLRSGNRVSGMFEDIENDEVQLRLGGEVAEERRIPVEGVLVIDFTGLAFNLDPVEAELASGQGHVLVLADGSVWQGTLEDVHRVGEGGGRTIVDAPVEMLFRREGGTERVPLASVARLYLGDGDLTLYPGAVAAVP